MVAMAEKFRACHGVATLGRSRDEWAELVADFLINDRALLDFIGRCMSRSPLYTAAWAAFRGGLPTEKVRAMLMRAVLDGVGW